MSKKSHHFLTLWPWPLTYDLEKLIRSGHYHYQCVYQIWEQSILWFFSYRVNTIAGGGYPSDTGDINIISQLIRTENQKNTVSSGPVMVQVLFIMTCNYKKSPIPIKLFNVTEKFKQYHYNECHMSKQFYKHNVHVNLLSNLNQSSIMGWDSISETSPRSIPLNWPSTTLTRDCQNLWLSQWTLSLPHLFINWLAPGRCGRNFKSVIFEHMLWIELMSTVLLTHLLSCEWHRIPLMISQIGSGNGLVPTDITYVNVDPDLCLCMALVHNELTDNDNHKIVVTPVH